jgi:hypothetical protein
MYICEYMWFELFLLKERPGRQRQPPQGLQRQLTTPDTEGLPCVAACQNSEEGGAASHLKKKKTLVEQIQPWKGTDQRTSHS